MEEQRITVHKMLSFTDIYIECPNCYHGQAFPAEKPETLERFTIGDIMDVDADGNARNFVHCNHCHQDFKLTWDYNNIDNFNTVHNYGTNNHRS
jgi:hypothetical protein